MTTKADTFETIEDLSTVRGGHGGTPCSDPACTAANGALIGARLGTMWRPPGDDRVRTGRPSPV